MKKIISFLAVAVCLLGTAYASPSEGKQIVPSDVGCSISDYNTAVITMRSNANVTHAEYVKRE